MKNKKRFIAGAICPACNTLDTVQMYREGEFDYRECVECGFNDKMRFKPVVRELETRVNVQDEVKKKETQVLRIIDPHKGSSEAD